MNGIAHGFITPLRILFGTVTFSRMDPEGKLVMGFRKASSSAAMQVKPTVNFCGRKIDCIILIYNYQINRMHNHLPFLMAVIQVKVSFRVFLRTYP